LDWIGLDWSMTPVRRETVHDQCEEHLGFERTLPFERLRDEERHILRSLYQRRAKLLQPFLFHDWRWRRRLLPVLALHHLHGGLLLRRRRAVAHSPTRFQVLSRVARRVRRDHKVAPRRLGIQDPSTPRRARHDGGVGREFS
jgi:hypothetical protein